VRGAVGERCTSAPPAEELSYLHAACKATCLVALFLPGGGEDLRGCHQRELEDTSGLSQKERSASLLAVPTFSS